MKQPLKEPEMAAIEVVARNNACTKTYRSEFFNGFNERQAAKKIHYPIKTLPEQSHL